MKEPTHGSNSQGRPLITEGLPHTTLGINPDASLNKSKRVRFAEHSKRRVYSADEDYEKTKSYSFASRKIFQKEATREGIRIKNLVASRSLPTGSAIEILLKRGLLRSEELLGIENLVSKNPKQSSLAKRSYTDLVLGMQKQMREMNENRVDAVMLAKVANANSMRMIEKAKVRANLASYPLFM
ncbi:hypothetical protein HJC23_001339 [Cyclotella cryptica]|uniref:Uncharacterized protein n=1 Tax=Cyclotella cryptica TaxID=29204 RepID=A0ABD3PQQ8_9STRA